ncbi:MAG: hypothetical protein J5678_00480 [Bacteroidaceae bacterium]|nr:hypothetical protein [Bacteroidaceae bacterium]
MYSPVIFRSLSLYAQHCDWQGMNTYLSGLSNSGFRTASYVLADHVLPRIDADSYWACFTSVALTDRKAFLGTFLKAAKAKYADHSLDFSNLLFVAFAQSTANDEVSIDRQKTLKALLPILRTPTEVQDMLQHFCPSSYEKQIHYLVSTDESLPAYYVLFQLMRRIDHSSGLLLQYLTTVIRRSTPMAFNFVSIMREYFGLERWKGNYSLTLQPYELSGLESGYQGFVRIINKIKS